MNQAHITQKASIKNILYLCLISTAFSLALPVQAQITPDHTLGTEASRLNHNQLINGAPGDKIEGGATRGSNLFHSFSQFNIQNGQRVYFANPTGIENIFTRVTGGNASNIFGTLGVDGGANLFLINPNGILFGQNARLDVQGSFVGTTANGVQFGNQGNFSATNPQEVPLLTINPSALFFNQINKNAAIQNNSVAPAGTDSAGINAYGLRVPDGKSLLLVGGNVIMDGGQLNVYGGRVELAGLATPGNVNLLVNGDHLSLKFPDNVTRASVSLTNQAAVHVAASGGGDIAINARNINILGGSLLSAGLGRGLGTPETVAGDITLNATGEIKITDSSYIFNDVRQGAKGNGGNITIDSGSFSLRDGAQLQASTFGQGNAGNVTVRTKDAVFLDNASIFSKVEPGGVGKGGEINIHAGSLSLQDGAQLLTATSSASTTQPVGRGDAGNLNIYVTGNVDIAGENNGIVSGIVSLVGTEAEGNGGNITINAASLSLRNGGQLQASTFGQGNAGNVTVLAKDAVSLAGQPTAILSTVEAGGVGRGGDINIHGASLSLQDGAELLTATSGAFGHQSAGKGDAGNVNIYVTGNVDIAGENNGVVSGIFSLVGTETEGHGGNITIDSGSFLLRDGGQLQASTFGKGNAGNVTVLAKDAVSLAGQPTAILSTVEAGGVGRGGDINIHGGSLSLQDGAELITATSGAFGTQPPGKGDAGNVNIYVTGNVDIAGENNGVPSGIFSTVGTETEGYGGNITIDSGSFSLRDGAQLQASTFGLGNAGNVTVLAKDAVSLVGDAYILSSVEAGGVGRGGDINIHGASLSLQDGAELLTATSGAFGTQPPGKGDAGNVNIYVTGNVDIAGENNGVPSGIFSTVGTETEGHGGNITIDSGSFSLRDGAQLQASTFGLGNAGNVTVLAKDAVSLLGDAYILSSVEAGGVGRGGDINIHGASLSLEDGALLITATSGAFGTQPAGKGDAGNVNIHVTGNVDIAGQKNGVPSGIGSDVGTETEGHGGNITIDSGSFSLRDGTQLVAITSGHGNAGNIRINAKDAVIVSGTSQQTGLSTALLTFTNSTATGIGGDITVNTKIFRISDGALLDAGTRNNQKGGDITVNANVFEALKGGQLITTTFNNGRAGKITVNSTDKVIISGIDSNYDARNAKFSGKIVNIGANSGLFVSASGSGITGDIEVNSPKVTLDNQGKLNAESASGNGGNINVNSDLLLLRRGTQITTNAGTAEKGGDGGNININSKFIVAIPKENSDITANAFTGKGGNIQINSQGIFGIESRPKLTEKSDITASSELGVAGVTKINAPDTSSIQKSFTGVFPNAIDTNALIAQSCIARATKRQENSFMITGSGALTPNRPGEGLVSNYTTGEVRGVEPTSRPWKKGDPIIEAEGLYRLSDGRLILSRSCRN